MAAALVDSSVLIAAASGRDRWHDDAEAILHGMDHGELPTGYVTNYALTETLNFIHERIGHDTAVDFLDRLVESAGFEIIHTPKNDFEASRSLFRQYDNLAFGDATMAASMEREAVEYIYSFDNDFDRVDFITRLETATNPFA